MGGFSMIFMLVAVGGMMFFMTRTQKKQQSQRQALLDSMKIGDNVVTIGGLHGVISDFDDTKKTVLIDCEGIILEFDRAAIKTVTPTTTTETTTIAEQPVEVVTEEVTEVQEADSNESSSEEAK